MEEEDEKTVGVDEDREMDEDELLSSSNWKEQLQQKINKDNFDKFLKYSSIDRHDGKGVLEDMLIRKSAANQWVGVEKVHGANFSIVTDGKQVKYAKRTSFLEPDSSFYNFQQLGKEYEPKMIQLFEYIRDNVTSLTVEGAEQFNFKDIKVVRVYGELYGGSYNHKDVEKVAGVKHVQKGVFYTPEIKFYAFDIRVGTQYFSYAKACEILERCGFEYGKYVVKGTLAEVIKFDVEHFESTVPKELGLPQIPENIAEGIVVRQYDSVTHSLLKKKADKFSEKVGAPRKPKNTDGAEEIKEEDPEVAALVSELSNYINENRLNSVMSKEEQPKSKKDVQKFIGLLAQDALEDFQKDFKDRLEALGSKKKDVTKKAAQLAAKLVVRETYSILRKS